MRFLCFGFLFMLTLTASDVLAQFDTRPIRIFGYFQNSFNHQTDYRAEFDRQSERNSFNLQQLNLLFQKELGRNWTAFINFEFLNNFSSSRQWGDANLEEAWVRYRVNEKFNLKLGLLIPVFNNLNEIKNRTPLLPYVIRPLVYETSFSEFVAVEEYLPTRAFAQIYGFLPINEMKLDYAVYIGNSPNINNQGRLGQTGTDTTNTLLVGGRVGLRVGELKVGVSATRENVNGFPTVEADLGEPPVFFNEAPRTRFGGDLSYHLGKFSLESEFIIVRYDDEFPEVSIDKEFYYATLGYRATERLLLYASYWLNQEDFTQDLRTISESRPIQSGTGEITVPTVGLSYNLNDRITFKAQFARPDIESNIPDVGIFQEIEYNFYSTAVSIFF